MTRRRAYVDTPDFIPFVARVLVGLQRRARDAEPEDLQAILELQADLDAVFAATVRSLRRAGYTWEQIAAANGTTRQAAQQRWGRLVDDDGSSS